MYSPQDRTLPIILASYVANGEIYSAMGSFVDYVNLLYNGGYGPGTIHPDYADLYLLDYYVAQVNNGGLSQFISNSGRHVHFNMAAALRAAQMIDVPELVDTIQQCQAWCAANPKAFKLLMRRYENQPELDPPSKVVNLLKYTDDEMSRYLTTLPDDMAQSLAARSFPPENANQLAAEFAAAVVRHRDQMPVEDAAAKAAHILAPLFTWKGRGDPHHGRVQHSRRMIIERHDKTKDLNGDDLRIKMIERVQEFLLAPELYERSIYTLKARSWLLLHPNRSFALPGDWQAKCDDILSASPFAEEEKARRDSKAHRKKLRSLPYW